MGQIFYCTCEDCGYTKKFNSGGGFAYNKPTLEMADSLMRSKKMKREVVTRMMAGLEPDVFYHALMQCPNCGTVHGRLMVSFPDGFKTRYFCFRCNAELEETYAWTYGSKEEYEAVESMYGETVAKVLGKPYEKKEYRPAVCPKCGSDKFRAGPAMVFWD